MKKRLWIGLTAGVVALAVILSLLFWDVLFPTKEGAVFNQAVEELKKADFVTMDVTQKTTTRLGEDSFQLTVEQVLSYGELDSKDPIILLEETFPGSQAAPYAEHYGKGTVYVQMEDSAAFRGKLSQQDALKRYAPVGLLDSQRYQQITTETQDGKTVVSFADPNAGESWAMPKGAKLITATGEAKLDEEGKIQKISYTATYLQGTAEVTLEAVAKVREEAKAFSLPNGDGFIELTCVDAPRMLAYTQARLQNLPSVTATMAEYNICERGGQIRADSYMVKNSILQLCHNPVGLQYKIDTDIISGTGETEKTITYQNGEYLRKTSEDPFIGAGNNRETLTEEEAAGRFYEALTLCTVESKYWKDITLTDLNGVHYLEFTYTDQWGEAQHRKYCADSGSHSIQQKTGYLAVDKSTGLVTASGIQSECVHSEKKTVTMVQQDMSLQSPSVDAHLALTDGMPLETAPENPATPLLYRVTGSNGQEMWLFGTIHIGDARSAYLPRKVYDILLASDALALEFDQEKFEKDLQENAYMAQNVAYLYNYINSKTEEHMDPEAYELALKYIKASGNFTYGVTNMKVSVWENIIGNFYLQLGHQYDPEKGMEMRLSRLAKVYNKPIREVESAMSQIEMLTRWSEDLQKWMLDSTLQTTLEAYLQETHNLYELWCAGDEAALRKEVNKKVDLSFIPENEREKVEALLAEYDKGMNEDRNKKMLKVAVSYLESQDTVFYAVGLAHLLDDTSGLVDALRQAGYTVEQVKYN